MLGQEWTDYCASLLWLAIIRWRYMDGCQETYIEGVDWESFPGDVNMINFNVFL